MVFQRYFIMLRQNIQLVRFYIRQSSSRHRHAVQYIRLEFYPQLVGFSKYKRSVERGIMSNEAFCIPYVLPEFFQCLLCFRRSCHHVLRNACERYYIGRNPHLRIYKRTESIFQFAACHSNSANLRYAAVFRRKTRSLYVKNYKFIIKRIIPLSLIDTLGVVNQIRLHAKNYLNTVFLPGIGSVREGLNHTVIRDRYSLMPPFCSTAYELVRVVQRVLRAHCGVDMQLHALLLGRILTLGQRKQLHGVLHFYDIILNKRVVSKFSANLVSFPVFKASQLVGFVSSFKNFAWNARLFICQRKRTHREFSVPQQTQIYAERLAFYRNVLIRVYIHHILAVFLDFLPQKSRTGLWSFLFCFFGLGRGLLLPRSRRTFPRQRPARLRPFRLLHFFINYKSGIAHKLGGVNLSLFKFQLAYLHLHSIGPEQIILHQLNGAQPAHQLGRNLSGEAHAYGISVALDSAAYDMRRKRRHVHNYHIFHDLGKISVFCYIFLRSAHYNFENSVKLAQLGYDKFFKRI